MSRPTSCRIACIGLMTSGLALFATPALAQTSPPPPDQDKAVTAAELQAMMAKPVDGRAVQNIWQGENYLLMTSVRLVPGIAELHDNNADLFIVQEGKADMLLGGHIEGGKITAPGETRGGTVIGGHVRHVAAGDIVWVPAGFPHQITPDPAGPFRYLAIKIPKVSGAAK